MSDDTIIAQIKMRPEGFNLSTAEVLQLNSAKVSNAVIDAMMSTSITRSTADRRSTAEEDDNNDPLGDHDAGIYMSYRTSAGERTLVQLEPTVYSEGKSGGVFANMLTHGIAKIKYKAVVGSPNAAISTNDQNAAFYFYFEKTRASLSYSTVGTSTANQFTLVRLDVKANSRETIVMQTNDFGTETGTQDNATIPFKLTKLRRGVYKVTPRKPLAPGEYCFLTAETSGAYSTLGAAAANRLFHFGIEAH